MSQLQKISTKESFSFSTIQKYLFWIVLFLLPMFIMPFPWDWTERSMSIMILLLSTVVVGIEVIKILWGGKTSILKSSIDLGIFLLLFSMFISTLFSVDFNSSIWGIDANLGGGLVPFIASLLVAISARTFIQTEKDFKYTLFALLGGFLIVNILSLLSFFGVNVWGVLPVYRDLYSPALPLFRSPKTHLLLNIVNLVLCINFIGESLIGERNKNRLFLPLIMGFVSVVNIVLFSIVQGMGLIIVSLVLLLLFAIFLIPKAKLQKLASKQLVIIFLSTIFLIAIPFVLLQIPSIRGAIIPEEFNLVSELSLGVNMAWMITMSVFASSFLRAVLGMGVDTYSIAYNLYRPTDVSLLSLGNMSFYHAGSELFTQFTNLGLVWLIVWLFLGFLLFKSFMGDMKSIGVKNDPKNAWRLLIIDLSITIIYVSSLFVTYTILIFFLLLILISLRSVVKILLEKDSIEKFIVKFWAVDLVSHMRDKKYTSSLSILLTVVVGIITAGLTIFWFSKGIASIHTLRAEAYLLRESVKYQEEEPTMEEREALINRLIEIRTKAVNLDKNNPLYVRSLALIFTERLNYEIDIYNQTLKEEKEKDAEQMISSIAFWRENALDMSRKSVEISPMVFANWDVNSRINLLLVELGVSGYEGEVASSLDRAIALNPMNYQLYFSRAQLFLMQDDMEGALQSLAAVLSINPYHIPSMILSANIYKEKGNTELYISYLEAALKVLENEELTELELYIEIQDELANVEKGGLSEDKQKKDIIPQSLGEGGQDIDLGLNQGEEPLLLSE